MLIEGWMCVLKYRCAVARETIRLSMQVRVLEQTWADRYRHKEAEARTSSSPNNRRLLSAESLRN